MPEPNSIASTMGSWISGFIMWLITYFAAYKVRHTRDGLNDSRATSVDAQKFQRGACGKTTVCRARKRPAINPRSREALQTLQPPLSKAKTRPPTRRGSPPELKPRGMQNQNSWDAGSFLRTTKLDLSLAQFLHISPKARAAMAEAIRLERNPKRIRQKTTRFAEPLLLLLVLPL